eukprot:m.501730 g.501730  ORF g.501730 m.501730 type:complete len:449 (-) comp21840_c1_seq6:577-1923(-)
MSNPFLVSPDTLDGGATNTNPFASAMQSTTYTNHQAKAADESDDEEDLGMSYIEMMCAAPREDNALARSILNTESSERTAETLRVRGAFENDDDDDSVQYENWKPRNEDDGSGCLLSSSAKTPRYTGGLQGPPVVEMTSETRSSSQATPTVDGATTSAPSRIPPNKRDTLWIKPDATTSSSNSGSANPTIAAISGNKDTAAVMRQRERKKHQLQQQQQRNASKHQGKRVGPEQCSPEKSTQANTAVSDRGSDDAPQKPTVKATPGAADAPHGGRGKHTQAFEHTREQLAALYASVHDQDGADCEPLNLKKYLNGAVNDMNSIAHEHLIVSRTFCKGPLSKMGAIRKNWKDRWFVLDLERQSLAYYVDESMANLKGGMRLEDIHCAVFSDDASEKGKRSFQIACENRTFNITAPTVVLARVWVAAINSFAYYAHGRNPVKASAIPSNGL